jgi:hypothetical protein
MKTYVAGLILLLCSVATVFAQTGEVALGDTSSVRVSRGKYTATTAGVPYFKVGAQAGKRLAFFSEIPSITAFDQRYVSLTGNYSNPSWLGSFAYNKLTGTPTTAQGYGLTDVDTYQTVATYAAMNALTYAANTARRVLVVVDEVYAKSNQWYMVWADSGGSMHADKLVTISEK